MAKMPGNSKTGRSAVSDTKERSATESAAAKGSQKRSLRISTADPNSSYHHQAVAIGEVWQEEGLVDKVTPLFTTGGIESVTMLADKRADFACVAANWLPLAATGKTPFPKALPVELMSPINSGPMFFAAAQEAKINYFSDLKGRRVVIGPADSGLVQHTLTIFRALGLPPDFFTFVYASRAEGTRMLIEGEVDAQFQPPIPNVDFTNLISRRAIKMVPFSGADLKLILDAVPHYAEAIVSKGAFPGHRADMATIAVVNVLAVPRDGDDDLVFDLTRAVIDRAADLAQRNPLFQGLDRLLAESGRRIIPVLKKAGAPQHAGAERAFRTKGLIP
jgi:uncharacterized protein